MVCSRRPKGVNSRKSDELESINKYKVVWTLSDIRDQLRRSTDAIKTVADGQAEGRIFDKDCTWLQILPYESAGYQGTLTSLMGTEYGEENSTVSDEGQIEVMPVLYVVSVLSICNNRLENVQEHFRNNNIHDQPEKYQCYSDTENS